ncbi:MAG: ROK family protein [Acidimicrobiales bacterium]
MAAIGIDLGGTKVQGAVVEGGEVVADAKVTTPMGVEDVVEAIAACVGRLGGTKGMDGVGVGAPGVVDVSSGTVVRAPNLPGFDTAVPLATLLGDALDGARVVVDNDVNAAVLAEHRFGAGQDRANLLGVWVGTGVGGGLVLDGRLRRGPGGVAGEIGHVTTGDDSRCCGCGLPGHLEAFAGRAGMEAEARRRHATGEPTLLVDLAGDKRMKSSVFAKALEAGDVMAVALLDDAVAALGPALASAVALVDLDLIVVGGGLAEKLGLRFVGRIEQAVRSRLFVRTSPLQVVPAALGDFAGALGASLLLGE